MTAIAIVGALCATLTVTGTAAFASDSQASSDRSQVSTSAAAKAPAPPRTPVRPATQACTRLGSSDGAYAYVCKTWYSEGGGLYQGGWWTNSHSSNATLWYWADGDQGIGFTGSYSETAHFYLAVCGPSTCGGWW